MEPELFTSLVCNLSMSNTINYPFLHKVSPHLHATASMHIVSLVLRCMVASTFLIAVIGKLLDYQEFVQGILRLGWIPERLSQSAAILLLVMELGVGLLMLSRRGVLLGAAVGGSLAAGFIVVTGALIARGTSIGCPCLGIFLKLPPSAMLGVDILLVSACLVLLRLCIRPHPMKAQQPDRVYEDRPINLCRLANWRQRVVPLLVTSYVVAIVIALQAGFAKEEQRSQTAQHHQIKLRYGDRAPHFALIANSGTLVSPQNLLGKWTLLCFVLPKCHACEAELRDIVKHQATWASKLNIVVVVVGKPLFASAEEAARRYAQHNQLVV